MQPGYQQNAIAMHAGKGLITLCRELSELVTRQIFKSKTSSCFPNFDASNAWATTHESVFFLVRELLSDFAAWIDLTSNADNLIVSVALEVTEHILLL